MKRSLLLTVCLTTLLLPLATNPMLLAANDFTSLGKVAPISESRGSMLVENAEGEPLLLVVLRDILEGKGARESLLVTHLPSGRSDQYFFPSPEVSNSNSYTLFVSKKNRFYLLTDTWFFEFDLASRKIVHSVDGMGGPAMAMDEDAEGNIYFAIFPTSELFRYSPESKKLENLVKLDPDQQYPTSMAIDEEGWIYTGIGTVRPRLIAWNPKTKERVDLSNSTATKTGTGQVLVTRSGKVFGKASGASPWLRLKRGKGTPVAEFTPPERHERAASLYWLDQRWQLPDGTAITDLSLREKKVRWKSADGEEKTIAFDYASEGASISSMSAAADGKVYGCTDHPMELWVYDPAKEQTTQLGHDPRIGGGNITKLLPWADGVVGNSYSKGDVYFYSPALAFAPEEQGAKQNPALLTNTAPVISRPRALMIHPDGEHLLSAGYPGYGQVGGGLLIYNLRLKQKVDLMPAAELVPDQSISSMAAAPDGETLYFSTTVLTPGGATPKATEAELAAFSWKDRKILWRMAPVPGTVQLTAIAQLDDRHLAGVTNEGRFYVVDLKERKTLRTQDLAETPAGSRGDTSFVLLPGGKSSLLMMRTTLYVLNHESRQLKKLATSPTPIDNVGPLVEGNLYYSSAGTLWRYTLPQSLTQ